MKRYYFAGSTAFLREYEERKLHLIALNNVETSISLGLEVTVAKDSATLLCGQKTTKNGKTRFEVDDEGGINPDFLETSRNWELVLEYGFCKNCAEKYLQKITGGKAPREYPLRVRLFWLAYLYLLQTGSTPQDLRNRGGLDKARFLRWVRRIDEDGGIDLQKNFFCALK